MGNTTAQKFFETTELLEMVLIILPFRDLLFAQRVCKTWKTCIDRSSKIQKGLFLRPIGQLTTIPGSLQGGPHVDKALARIPFSKYVVAIPSIAFAVRNPLLEGVHWPPMDQWVAGELDDSMLPPSWRYPEASWRRMLLIQPALPTFMLPKTFVSSQVPREAQRSPQVNGPAMDTTPVHRAPPARMKIVEDHPGYTSLMEDVRTRLIHLTTRRNARERIGLRCAARVIAELESELDQMTATSRSGAEQGESVENCDALKNEKLRLELLVRDSYLKAFYLAISEVVEKTRLCDTAAEIEQLEEDYRRRDHRTLGSEPHWFAFP